MHIFKNTFSQIPLLFEREREKEKVFERKYFREKEVLERKRERSIRERKRKRNENIRVKDREIKF